MKNPTQSIIAILGGVILVGALASQAADWPQWRGPQGDGKVTGFQSPDKWPPELTPKWKVQVGTGDATPALVGDKLYVFARQEAEEVILCLNAADGKEIWKQHYEAQAVSGAAARHPGPRSSPAVADGKVVTLGVGGVVCCLDAASGKQLWRKDDYSKLVPRFFTGCSPIMVDGVTIVHVGGPATGSIIAYDLASGEQKWKWEGDAPAYASPAVLTAEGIKQIATVTDKRVVGLAIADGKLLWQIPFPATGMSWNAATPVIDGQTVIVSGKGRGTKALKIEKQGDKLEAKELWSNPQVATFYNTPVLKDGLLFGLSDRANLFCLNAQTGKEVWIDPGKRGGSGFGTLVDAGSVILALANDSRLIAFKPSDKEYVEVAAIKVAEKETYAYPVLAGNRVFVRDQNSVALLTLQ